MLRVYHGLSVVYDLFSENVDYERKKKSELSFDVWALGTYNNRESFYA